MHLQSAAAQGLGSVDSELGYVSSPWVKSKEPQTLAALRKLRPANLPKHSLALWVTDRLARDSGVTPDMADIKASISKFKHQGGFWIRDDETGLWISNGKIGLSLLPIGQGAGIASFYNLETGTECIFKQPPASTPWKILVLRKSQDGSPPPIKTVFPHNGTDLSCLKEVDGGALRAGWQVNTSMNRLTVDINWKPVRVPGGEDEFAVGATIMLDKGSPLAKWRAGVKRVAGSRHSLLALMYPLLRSLGADGENDLVCSTGGHGRGHIVRGVTSFDPYYGLYPVSWPIQFMSLSFGDSTTMYMACYDGEGYTKKPVVSPSGGTYIAHVAWSPDELRIPYDTVIGPIRGDWYDAARVYRQWALKQVWCAKGSLWNRVKQGTASRSVVETDLWLQPHWVAAAGWNNGKEHLEATTKLFRDADNANCSVRGSGAGGTCG